MRKSTRYSFLIPALLSGCVDTGPRKVTGPDAADAGQGRDTPSLIDRLGGEARGDLPVAVPPSGSDMRDITTAALVREMSPGWNLGNTLDAVGGETAWGNPVTTQAMIQAVVQSGFKAIRIPVTWRQHHGGAPDFTIDPVWMARVRTVVDYALTAGAYAVINLHHDGGGDTAQGAWIRKASTDFDGVMTQYLALWEQIATYFRNYPDRLVLESMNEVGFDDLKVNGAVSQAAYDLLNTLNYEFVSLVRASGGNNGQRHLLLAGYYTDIDQSIKGVTMPADSRCIMSLHYYTPSRFAINGTLINGSPATWGSATEISTLQNQFAKVKTNFTDKGIPVIVGEFGAVKTTEASSRVFWAEWVAKAACDLGAAPYFWDNGEEFNRATLAFRTPSLVEALTRACAGIAYTPSKG
jgi:endoglucanase